MPRITLSPHGRLLRRAAVCMLLSLLASRAAQARGLQHVRFVVVDAQTHQPIALSQVLLEDKSGAHAPCTLLGGIWQPAPTPEFDLQAWKYDDPVCSDLLETPTVITIPEGGSVTLRVQQVQQAQTSGPPIPDIYVKVTAKRLIKPTDTSGGTTLTGQQVINRLGEGGGSKNSPVNSKTSTGVAEDSAGQEHVRGEHAEIAYVVDGVPLPDTVSGRLGAIIVPATINTLDILTGAYAPEFGGQTAAVLNVTTLPGVKKATSEFNLVAGSYDTLIGNYTALGPLGTRASYVVNLAASETRNIVEPQQPDNQTAHNAGSNIDMFSKLRYAPSRRDTVTLTLSRSPSTAQINNRTGLSSAFAQAGEGYGFLGLRNADGTVPMPIVPGALGSQTLVLPSQESEGMDITQREITEFGILQWRRQLAKNDVGQFAFTILHSGQDVHNDSPGVNLLNLPVDNSIEYNPTATRNIHHIEMNGSLTFVRGTHQFKTGMLLDDENGTESFQIIPASQLALDELAALDGRLAPTGTVETNAQGAPVLDVYGNPVYKSNVANSPVVTVHRSGFYRAAYAQDTWSITKRLIVNYGLRFDWFKQSLNLAESNVDAMALEPRVNFSYELDRVTVLRWSYNRLFNTPPVAQGAAIGSPIQPETLDQYDVSAERQIVPGQKLKTAYYVKQIKNQVDTGLLVPGSEIGLFSAVNFQIGAVHGVEVAYDFSNMRTDARTKKKFGMDGYVNWSYSIAAPNGLDNTGAPAPDYNDHDQRNTVGSGLEYTFKGGATAGISYTYGSGLASSPIPPSTLRIPRSEVGLQFSSGPRLFRGHGGLGLEIDNLFDARTVINFDSGFSGTRFMQGRRILLNVFGSF